MPQVRLVLLSLALVMSLFAAPNAFGKGASGGGIIGQSSTACDGIFFECFNGDQACCYGSNEWCLHACEAICDSPCDSSEV